VSAALSLAVLRPRRNSAVRDAERTCYSADMAAAEEESEDNEGGGEEGGGEEADGEDEDEDEDDEDDDEDDDEEDEGGEGADGEDDEDDEEDEGGEGADGEDEDDEEDEGEDEEDEGADEPKTYPEFERESDASDANSDDADSDADSDDDDADDADASVDNIAGSSTGHVSEDDMEETQASLYWAPHESLASMLLMAGLCRVRVPGDGACAYWALLLSLGLVERDAFLLTPSPLKRPVSAAKTSLRALMRKARHAVVAFTVHESNRRMMMLDPTLRVERTVHGQKVMLFSKANALRHGADKTYSGPPQLRALATHHSADIAVITQSADRVALYSADDKPRHMHHIVSWRDVIVPRLQRQRGDAEAATPPERRLVVIAYNGVDHFDGVRAVPVVAAAPLLALASAAVPLDGLEQMLADKGAENALNERKRARISAQTDALMDNGVNIHPVCAQMYGAPRSAGGAAGTAGLQLTPP